MAQTLESTPIKELNTNENRTAQILDSNQNKDSVDLLGLDKIEDENNEDMTGNTKTDELFPNNAVQS